MSPKIKRINMISFVPSKENYYRHVPVMKLFVLFVKINVSKKEMQLLIIFAPFDLVSASKLCISAKNVAASKSIMVV